MRILITGAAGFIGSHLALELSKNPANEILAIDSFSEYYAVELKHKRVRQLSLDSPLSIVKVDLRDFEVTQSLVKDFRPQTIYHLAAQAGVRTPLEKYVDYFDSNLSAFSNIMTSAVLHSTENFLYASSSSVYGNRESGSFRESEPGLRPSSIYGSTKLANEIMARAFSDRHGIRTRGLRYFTVYGPWGRPDMAYFRIITSILNHSPFQLYGDGSVLRDFTYISDAVKMTMKLGEELSQRSVKFSDVVNLGGGVPRSLTDMILFLENSLGEKMSVISKSQDLSDVQLTKANPTYLESLIGTTDFIPMESGLEEVLKWSREKVTKEELLGWSNSVG